MATFPASGVAPIAGKFNVAERLVTPKVRSYKIDFANGKGPGAGAAAAADVIQGLPVFAGEMVEAVYVRVVVPSTTVGSVFGLGDGTATQGYMANTKAATAAADTLYEPTGPAAGNGILAHPHTAVPAFTPALTTPGFVRTSFGKLYAADDTIDILVGATAPLDGIVEIYAVIREIFPK